MTAVCPSSPHPAPHRVPTAAHAQMHPRPPTLGAFPELEPVLLDDAQHVLVGVPGVVGDQEVAAAGQQLDEGGAGARAQSVPGLGLVQGQLQIFQVPGELQQAAEAGGRGVTALLRACPGPAALSLGGAGLGGRPETT